MLHNEYSARHAARSPSSDPESRPPRDAPPWAVIACGAVFAAAVVWLSLAWLSGIPGDVVEWVILSLFAAFGYALGTLVPGIAMVLRGLLERFSTVFVVFAVIGGGGAALLSFLPV